MFSLLAIPKSAGTRALGHSPIRGPRAPTAFLPHLTQVAFHYLRFSKRLDHAESSKREARQIGGLH
jgi:hypothetical protein